LILSKELIPIVSLDYISRLVISGPWKLLFQLNFDYNAIVGTIVFVTAAIILGILSRSFFETFWSAIFYIALLLIISLSIDRLIAASITGGVMSSLPDVTQNLTYAAIDFILYLPLAIIGYTYTKEAPIEKMREIDVEKILNKS